MNRFKSSGLTGKMPVPHNDCLCVSAQRRASHQASPRGCQAAASRLGSFGTRQSVFSVRYVHHRRQVVDVSISIRRAMGYFREERIRRACGGSIIGQSGSYRSTSDCIAGVSRHDGSLGTYDAASSKRYIDCGSGTTVCPFPGVVPAVGGNSASANSTTPTVRPASRKSGRVDMAAKSLARVSAE